MSNFILDLMREDDLAHDPWGTAMAWGFAVAENLCAIGEDWDPLAFQPSPYGAVIESYEDFAVRDYIENTPDAWAVEINPDRDTRIADAQYAAKIIDRFLDWCKLAGLDY